MTTQPTPRFTVRHYVTGGCYISLDEADKGFRAVALCDALHEGWDDPDGWDYGLSKDELGNRKRDGHTVQVLAGDGGWINTGCHERSLRFLTTRIATRRYRASKRSITSLATENVPLHKVIGRTLPDQSSPIDDIRWKDVEDTWKWRDPHTLPWHPLPVNDDGTVTVLEKESEE